MGYYCDKCLKLLQESEIIWALEIYCNQNNGTIRAVLCDGCRVQVQVGLFHPKLKRDGI